MTEEELEVLEQEEDAPDLIRAVPVLIAEVRRLRALIKDTEGLVDGCPWCREGFDPENGAPHTDDCPAFTPHGTMK